MFSRMGSKKTTRRDAASTSAAPAPAPAAPTPAPEASTSTALPPMRTRSGKVLTPLAEGVRTLKSKLTGGRRGKAAAAPSTSAQAEATSSNVVDTASASTPHKAASKKRPTKGRTTKGKAPKTKPAKDAALPPADDSSASTSAPVAVVPVLAVATAPVPAPLEAITAGPSNGAPIAPAVPLNAPSAPAANPQQRPRPEVPENRRLKRQGACYIDKDGWPLPEGEYLEKDGTAPTSALLKEVASKVDLDDLRLRPRAFMAGLSIYGLAQFQPNTITVYDPLNVTLPPQMPGAVVDPAPAPAPVVPAAPWEPIIFPAIPPAPEVAPEDVGPRIGTRLTRQYAAFFDEEGFPLPTGREGGEEPEPIGEIVANILKAGRGDGPYPSTWRGSLFEPEEQPAAEGNVQAPRPIRPLPVVPPGRRLTWHNAVTLDAGGAVVYNDGPTAPISPRPQPKYPITRQNAVYLDKDGFALPPGETTTAEKQFPSGGPAPAAAPSGSSAQGPKLLTGAAGPSAPRKAPGGLTSLFARRSGSNLAAFNPKAVKALVTEEKPAAAAGEVEEDLAQGPEPEPEEREEEVVDAPETDGKGKKRAREADEEDVDEEDAPRVQRIRTVNVRSYTKESSLLRVKVSVIPLPTSGFQPGDELLVYPPGKGPLAEKASKRSREDFEAEEGSASESEEEPATKKARREAA
ncbi:hypothetical protein OH77DRAFT_1085051 [Trametes cingulata]|nr:hypothetical protein OH77DRAFT_1085051 [Trametes cingulata]